MKFAAPRSQWQKVYTTTSYSLVQAEGGELRLSTVTQNEGSEDGILLSPGTVIYVNADVELWVKAKFTNTFLLVQEQSESRLPDLIGGRLPVQVNGLDINLIGTTITNQVDVLVKNTESFPVSVSSFYATKIVFDSEGNIKEEHESNGLLNRSRSWSYSIQGSDQIAIATSWVYQ